MRRNLIILFFIIFLAIMLRFWQLGAVPLSPDWDEAALGYNAYSILHTGRDEYGKFLPIVLQSFNDYKPALYAYLTIPAIAFFDLNVFAVRFPSAVFGIATVIATYFLVKELFKKESIALLTSFLLAISPWHIQFSRIAFEANIGLACNIFGALFFLKSLKKPWLLFFSIFFFSLSLYAYQSEKVFTPLFLAVLIFLYRRQFFSLSKRYLILASLLGVILILPMVSYAITNPESFARAKGVSIFAQPTNDLQESIAKTYQDKQRHDAIGLLFDNNRVIIAKTIIANYLSHFDFNWLFIRGDLSRHHAPQMGLLYIWEIPFILIGIYNLIFGDFDKKTKLFLLCWLFIAPLPAAITFGVPHAVRTLNFLPTFQIFTALGVLWFIKKVFSTKMREISFLLSFLFLIFNFLYYLDQYFIQQNYFYARDWQYGYAQLVPEVAKLAKNYHYKKIVVSNTLHLDQSYIFFLFYLKYPPLQYQYEELNNGGFRENHAFSNFEFRPIHWGEDSNKADILYVGNPGEFSPGIKIYDTIFDSLKNELIVVVGK